MSVIIKSGSSGNLADVDANSNVKVNLPTTATQAGYTQTAYVPTGTVSKVAHVTEDNATYAAEVRQIIDIDFNSASTTWATKIGTNATTMTKAVQNGAMRLNNSAITTTTTGIAIYSCRTVNIETGYDYVVNFMVRHSNATATNKQAEWGLGYYAFAAGQAAQMNEFIGFRHTTAGGFVGVLATSTGGAPGEQTTNLNSNAPLSDSIFRKYSLVITDSSVEFWIDDVYQARLTRDTSTYGSLKGVSLPMIARVFNSGAASAAATYDFADLCTFKIGADDGMPAPFRLAAMGKSSYYYQPDITAAATATHSFPASGTAPTANAGSNTASAANSTAVLGGIIRNTLTGVTVTLSSNILWTGYQNPAVPTTAGVATNARNFYCTGITIGPMVVTTALVGGGFTAAWFATIGNTALSLATTDADGTTAVAQKAPRYVPLSLVSTLGATAAIGVVSTDVGDHQWLFPTPLVVHPGEFICIGMRTIAVTAAVTTGTADAMIGINGYWD